MLSSPEESPLAAVCSVDPCDELAGQSGAGNQPGAIEKLREEVLALGSRWLSHELVIGKAENRIQKLEESLFASMSKTITRRKDLAFLNPAPTSKFPSGSTSPPRSSSGGRSLENAGGPDDGGGGGGNASASDGSTPLEFASHLRLEKGDIAVSNRGPQNDLSQRMSARERERQLEAQIASRLATFLPTRRASTPRRMS